MLIQRAVPADVESIAIVGVDTSRVAYAGIVPDDYLTKDYALVFPGMKGTEKKRTIQTAEPISRLQKGCTIIPLGEFNEIDSGVCECMSYQEIQEKMPQVYSARKKDKYNYVYPNGEGYRRQSPEY